MLAADVSRINFPALSTISGIEKLPFSSPFSFFFPPPLFKADRRSLSRISLGKFWRDRVSETVLSQRFLRGGLGRSFLLCSLVSFVVHHRFTRVENFRGRTRKCWKFVFLEVGHGSRGWGYNLRCKRFEGLISGGEKKFWEIFANFRVKKGEREKVESRISRGGLKILDDRRG